VQASTFTVGLKKAISQFPKNPGDGKTLPQAPRHDSLLGNRKRCGDDLGEMQKNDSGASGAAITVSYDHSTELI